MPQFLRYAGVQYGFFVFFFFSHEALRLTCIYLIFHSFFAVPTKAASPVCLTMALGIILRLYGMAVQNRGRYSQMV